MLGSVYDVWLFGERMVVRMKLWCECTRALESVSCYKIIMIRLADIEAFKILTPCTKSRIYMKC